MFPIAALRARVICKNTETTQRPRQAANYYRVHGLTMQFEPLMLPLAFAASMSIDSDQRPIMPTNTGRAAVALVNAQNGRVSMLVFDRANMAGGFQAVLHVRQIIKMCGDARRT